MNSSVENILERIMARRSFAFDSMSLQEQSKAPVKSDTILKTLKSININELDRLGLSLSADIENQDIIQNIVTGNIIGSAHLTSDLGAVSIIIEPKVSAARLVSIIEFLQNDSFFSNEESESYSGQTDILTLQILRCIQLVSKSLASGSIRGYKSLSKKLPYIKGRANYCDYLLNNWSHHKEIECNYSELTIDTPRNRVFRLALVKSSRVIAGKENNRIFNTLRMILFSLTSVKEQEFTQLEIEKIARENPRDASALLACRDIICNLSISPHPGHSRNFFSYAINMAHLFENYCHKLMSIVLFEKNYKPCEELLFPIEGIDEPIRLDGLYSKNNRKILIECKYKIINTLKDVKRPDIYQTVAYCSHSDVDPEMALMLFPCENSDEAAKLIGTIGGFNISCNKIHVVTVGLCFHPEKVVKGLQFILSKILRQ
ncbi:5-methylcytosine restriction system specificity protein McrC [Citrobacter freundii]|uniref:5-methylcytosine restriction system specificity protein McrC n=1 Tax=Citrobacter freundii TaxID=546 RepID=UPI00397E1A3A